MQYVCRATSPLVLALFLAASALTGCRAQLLTTHVATAPTAEPSTVPEISSWSFVDNGGANGLNLSPARAASTPRLAVLGTKLYATWSEANAVPVAQIRVAVYNGDDASPGWTMVGGAGASGLNKAAAVAATVPTAAVVSGKLYVSWQENNGGIAQVRVAVYNGNDSAPAWAFVDVNGANGINKNPTIAANTPRLFSFSDKLYAHWQEANGGGIVQARVAVYNGNDSAPAWTFVDVGGANGMNIAPGRHAAIGELGAMGGELYLAWQERNVGGFFNTRVSVYNGNDSAPAWTSLDGGGADGLNYATGANAKQQALATLGGKLYAIWREVGAGLITQVRVKVYNGNASAPAWAFVDGGAASGLNVDPTHAASDPLLVASNSRLYALWSEQSSGGVFQLRVKVYNGDDAAPAWTSLDGNATDVGLNKLPANAATVASAAALDGGLYLAWAEGTPGQISVSVGR